MPEVADPPRGFPADEFEARTKRAQALMAGQGLGAILLTTEAELRYFSGFLTQFWQSPTRPWFLVVPAEGKPVAVIPTIGAECMGRTWVEDIRTWPSPSPDDDGTSLLAGTLMDLMGSSDRIGLAMGPETHLRMPLNQFAALKERLPGKLWCDATGILRGLRMVKSEREIGKIAHVCGIVSGVFEDLPEILHLGMTEQEVRASGRPALVGKRMMTRVGRAREFGETRGFIKILVDAETGQILGAAILGLNGDEAVHSLLDVMYTGQPYTMISRAVHIHPTVSELIPTVLQELQPL